MREREEGDFPGRFKELRWEFSQDLVPKPQKQVQDENKKVKIWFQNRRSKYKKMMKAAQQQVSQPSTAQAGPGSNPGGPGLQPPQPHPLSSLSGQPQVGSGGEDEAMSDGGQAYGQHGTPTPSSTPVSDEMCSPQPPPLIMAATPPLGVGGHGGNGGGGHHLHSLGGGANGGGGGGGGGGGFNTSWDMKHVVNQMQMSAAAAAAAAYAMPHHHHHQYSWYQASTEPGNVSMNPQGLLT
ncbi:hypothetical protein J437_LFUL010220 [Ladona fulva]|uniref:Homeobox domain-containing protein n=1 Tax=Ladona fulva TaxID=123851 RepID=A0A8K0K7P0_LADFU|nr:hypothetical protein J437_LFUL010220 [Ladona fulva]